MKDYEITLTGAWHFVVAIVVGGLLSGCAGLFCGPRVSSADVASVAISLGNTSTLDKTLADQPALAREGGMFPGGGTLLHWAAICGREDALQVLLRRGAEVNRLDDEGRTALHYAADFGRAGAIQVLAEAGANLESRCEAGDTALHLAADYEISVRLRSRCEGGDTALHLAARSGYESCVRLRCEGGDTALHLAARNGYESCVRLLLSHGANVQAGNDRGETPLHAAMCGGAFGNVQEAAAEAVDAAPREKGLVGPGGSLASSSRRTSVEHIAEILVEGGARVNARASDGTTSLLLAAVWANEGAVQWLLDAGADPTLTTDTAMAPIHCALSRNKEEVVRLLRNYRRTPGPGEKP